MMKATGWLMICVVLILCAGTGAVAADAVQQGQSFWVNPAWQDRVAREDLKPGIRLKHDLEAACHSENEVAALLRERLSNRSPEFSFNMAYDFTFEEVRDILARAEAAAVADDDYLAFSIQATEKSWRGDDGDVHVSYTVGYVSTAAEEQAVNDRVDEILAAVLVPGMNHEEQLKAIHDWIVLNVAYDERTDPEYSAWAALDQGRTVCQGYALLTCKMLQKCGIPVRIINSPAMNHAWNMVYLCGLWFHLDVTWNDPVPDVPGRVLYTYYNLSDAQISQGPNPHYGWSPDTVEAPEPYTEGICAVTPAPEFTLEHVMAVLRNCTGHDGGQADIMALDMSGDGRIGPEDVLSMLHALAGTHPPPGGLVRSAAAYDTAAAATAVVMTETSIPEPVVISADKPFIFLIRDQVTDMILFMGRVMDPVSR